MPIEETFRREFPGFDPFPFGARSWIHGLVRHVQLAEPLVDDFARCFQGVGPAEAAAPEEIQATLMKDGATGILPAYE
jgi:hypothetical protein